MLIGRASQIEQLQVAVREAARGHGSLVLVDGEAGVGKTALATAATEHLPAATVRGTASRDATPPYGPIVKALRVGLRTGGSSLEECGPLLPHLALLLPELGDPPERSDQETIFEGIRSAFVALATSGTTVVILDDLQWSDDATLDFMTFLVGSLHELSILVIGRYRPEEVDRDHSLRRFRSEARRDGRLAEIHLLPLGPGETGALAGEILGGPVTASLTRKIHDRTQGIPFFVEEFTLGLVAANRLHQGAGGFELDGGAEVTIPATIRDAVRLRTASLSSAGRAAAEVAAVAGENFELARIAGIATAEGTGELIERGLILEDPPGRAGFRHALARDAIYADVPWLARRDLHRRLAEQLTAAGESKVEIARHRLGAHEPGHARKSLLAAMDEFVAVNAYRDAMHAGRRALELWEAGDDVRERLETLERYASCAELGGERSEAARAWREVADLRRSDEAHEAAAEAHRHLAGIYVLEGKMAHAIEARNQAAGEFAKSGALDESVTDRLAAADYLQLGGAHTEAIDVARRAADEAKQAGRIDLQAAALGIQGVAVAKRGDLDGGLELARSGLSLALDTGISARTGSLYWSVATVLETAANYEAARDTMDKAIGLCHAARATRQERTCQECMAYLLREIGEWSSSVELCERLADDGKASPGARLVVDGIHGSIEGFRGNLVSARSRLNEALESAIRFDVLSMQVDISAALAWVAEAQGDHEVAASHCRFLLQRWERSEDAHYAVWGLRWAASFFAQSGQSSHAHASVEALGRIAAMSGHPDALAALAHALGEAAYLDGEVELAVQQVERAVALHGDLDIPGERAQISLRAGVILAAAGDRELALTRLTEAHRTAKKLGALPVTAMVATVISDLGESVEVTLGKRAATGHDGAGLSRRELEVMRLVATGQTNREVAGGLFLSPRTVDMHVRNILSKLGCRSRVEAANRARELGLLS